MDETVGLTQPRRMINRAGFTLAVIAFMALMSARPDTPAISLISQVNCTRMGTAMVFKGSRVSSAGENILASIPLSIAFKYLSLRQRRQDQKDSTPDPPSTQRVRPQKFSRAKLNLCYPSSA